MSSLENPFASQKPLKHDDAGYIEAALGKEDAELFRSIDNEGKKKKKVEPPRGSLELTEEERKLVETEKAERPWTKKQYIEWAESFGKDAKWVDDTFIFHPDGTTSVQGSLDLSGLGISEFPKGVMSVSGDLKLDKNNGLTSLENLPQEVDSLSLAEDPRLASLVGLPKKIGYMLYLYGNRDFDDFPDDVQVGAIVMIGPNQLKLKAALEKLGISYHVFGY